MTTWGCLVVLQPLKVLNRSKNEISSLLACSVHSFVHTQATRPTLSMAPSLASDPAHVEEVKLQRLHGGYTSIYFASVIAFIILIFGVAHWLRRLNRRLHLQSTSYGKAISTWLIPSKRSLHGVQVLGVDVLSERVVLAIVYFGLNIGLSVWDIDWHHYTTFANRLGW
jgi:hypothetical protein